MTFHAPDWLGSRRWLVALFVILAIAAAIRVRLFTGYVGLDDAEYSRFAYQIAHGSLTLEGYDGPLVFPLRLGVVAPAALMFRLWGLSEWAMVVYPFVISMAAIALIYVCASLMFGYRAGLVAAVLLAVFPMDVDNATKLLPDLPGAFYAAAAVTTILIVDARARRRPSVYLGGLLAGVLLGASWECKESVSYLAPFCAGLMLIAVKKRDGRALLLWGGVAVGSVAVLAGEMIVYRHFTGDLLFRFHAVERDYHQWDNGFFTEGSAFGWRKGDDYGHALMRRLFVSGPSTIFLNRAFMFLPLVCVGVTFYAWIRRDRSFLIPAVWFWTLVAMFNFASSSATSYLPLPLFERYLYLIFFPTILLVAGFLAQVIWSPAAARSRTLVGAAVATSLFVGWIGGSQLLFNLRHPPTWWLSDTREIHRFVTPETVVYSDALSLRAFEFFNGYPNRTAWTDLEKVSSPGEIAIGSLVLINRAYIQWLDRNAGMWVAWPAPQLTSRSGYARHLPYDHLPPRWTLIWRNHDVALYRVDRSTDSTVRNNTKS